MDTIERFLIDGNVARFFDHAANGTDQSSRVLFARLMIEEENKIARMAERLDCLDSYISRCDSWISKQRKLIDACADAHESLPYQPLLRNLMELRSSLLVTRDWVRKELEGHT